jgi:tetratricopeptide (TPR) repeat protein/transglutaminase-like putative cysteine protease
MITPLLALTALLVTAAPSARTQPAPFARDLAAERHAAAIAALDRDHGPRAVVALTELRELADQVPDRTRGIQALARLLDDPAADPELRALARLRLAREERARGNLQRAATQLARLGIVTRWLVMGPFDNEGNLGLDRAEPPELALDPKATAPGKGREVRWRPLPPEAVVDGEVGLGAVLRPGEQVTAYALAVVDSPRDQPARLWFGASGRSKVWVNGVLALEDRVDHPARFDQRGALVSLKSGPNRLLVKLAHDAGWMGFALRLADARGDGLPLTVREPAAVRGALPPLPAPGPGPRHIAGLVERLAAQAAALSGGVGGPARRAFAEALRAQLVALALRRTFPPRSVETAVLARRLVEAAPGWLEGRLLAASQEEDGNRRLDQLRAAEALDADEPRVQRLLAEELLRLDRTHDAVRAAERAVAAAPGWVEARLALAQARERAGQGARARLERLALAERVPATAPALEAAAQAASEGSEPRRAAGWLRTAVALAFDLPGPRAQLTSLLLQLGDVAGAVVLLEEAQRLDPADTSLRLRLAELLAANGRGDEAEAQFEAALRLCAEDAEGWERRGRARLRAGRPGEALLDLRRALELRPQQPALKELVQSLEPSRLPFEAPYAADAAALARAPLVPAPGDDLVVLSDLEVVRVQQSGLASRFQQSVIKVLTARGVDEARRQSQAFTPGRQELRVERGRIHRPDGTVVEAWEDQESSASEPWYRMYYDTHVRTLTFTALQPGDVLEVAWRLDDVAESNLLADAFNDLTPVDGGPARRSFEYVLLLPSARAIHANKPAGVSYATRSLPGGLTEHRWSAGAIARFVGEPRLPGWSEVFRYLHVSTFASWDEVNAFYWGLVKEQLRPGEELKALARRLAGEALRSRGLPAALPPGGGEALEPGARRAVVAALHAFVVMQTRYVALEFGIHGYKPYAVDQVLDRRFGDCKDKASLTHALLASVGIESRLVLLRMSHLGAIPEFPASLAVFNHAILRVPSLDLWLDGTAVHSGTGEVPGADRGATVLVINPAGPPRFGQLPLARPEENRTENAVTFRLQADGAATVEARFTQAGAGAAALRRAFQSEADRAPSLERSLGQLYPGLRVEQVTFSDLSRLEEPVREAYTARLPRFARAEAGTLAFTPFGQPASMTNGWAQLSTRRLPLQLDEPATSRATYQVELPPGAAEIELPAPASSSGPHLDWSLEYRAEPGRVVAEFSMAWKSDRVPPADYPAFREQLVALDRAVARTVVVRLAPDAAGGGT